MLLRYAVCRAEAVPMTFAPRASAACAAGDQHALSPMHLGLEGGDARAYRNDPAGHVDAGHQLAAAEERT
jgi:hypothetical protein